MTLTADYYKFSDNIKIGTGEVMGIFEIILQKNNFLKYLVHYNSF